MGHFEEIVNAEENYTIKFAIKGDVETFTRIEQGDLGEGSRDQIIKRQPKPLLKSTSTCV